MGNPGLSNQAGLSIKSKAYPEPQELLAYAEFVKATKPLLLPAPLSAYRKVLATLTPDFWDNRLQLDKQNAAFAR